MTSKPRAVVFLVQHAYELNDGEDEIKTVGIFRSKSDATKAVEHAKTLPGFKRYKKNFFIDPYELNKLHWEEGFVTMRPKKTKKKIAKRSSKKAKRK